eukprot:6464389-Amphidinium_carterae.1
MCLIGPSIPCLPFAGGALGLPRIGGPLADKTEVPHCRGHGWHIFSEGGSWLDRHDGACKAARLFVENFKKEQEVEQQTAENLTQSTLPHSACTPIEHELWAIWLLLTCTST